MGDETPGSQARTQVMPLAKGLLMAVALVRRTACCALLVALAAAGACGGGGEARQVDAGTDAPADMITIGDTGMPDKPARPVPLVMFNKTVSTLSFIV